MIEFDYVMSLVSISMSIKLKSLIENEFENEKHQLPKNTIGVNNGSLDNVMY